MAAEDVVVSLDSARRRREQAREDARLFNIKEVGDRCRLPGPVIAQLVPRTWTADGWMYTGAQVSAAIDIAENLRRGHKKAPQPPVEHVACDRCGRTDVEGQFGWLSIVGPDSSVNADSWGHDFCPACLVTCPDCAGTESNDVCTTCWGAGQVAKQS